MEKDENGGEVAIEGGAKSPVAQTEESNEKEISVNEKDIELHDDEHVKDSSVAAASEPSQNPEISIEYHTEQDNQEIHDNASDRIPPKPTIQPLKLPEFKSAPEMSQVASLYYTLDTKFYYCGFVYKLNCLGADGKPLYKKTDGSPDSNVRKDIIQNDGYWSKWWMEMWGSVLHLWRVPDELASFCFTASLPIDRIIKNEIDPPIELMTAIKSVHQPLLINFADSMSELFSPQKRFSFENNPSPPIPYNCIFALSTSCSNLYLFASASFIQANQWVCAMRLAMWEMKKLNLLFTRKLLKKPTMMVTWKDFDMEPFESFTFRGELRYEGPLQVRLPYSNRWKQFHVVATTKTGQEAYLTNNSTLKAIFGKKDIRASDPSKRGTLMFYDSKAAMKKGKLPLFMMTDVTDVYAIWPEDATDEKLQLVSLAKIEGSFILPESSALPDSSTRTFESFKNGFPQVKSLEGVENVITGFDSRQLPTDLLILAPSSYALSKWIVATLASFSLDSGNPQIDEEIKEMTKLPEPEEDEIQPELVKVEWPSQLYLSLTEVGGLQVPHTYSETMTYFSHFLDQKMTFSRQGQLKMWSRHTAKGEWERGLCDRKEMEFKLSALFKWVDLVATELTINSINVAKPEPMVLVSAMATILPWLGEVLTSMVGTGPVVDKPKSIASSVKAPSTVASDANSATTSSDGEGSVSEEERSSEGSQSETEESEVSATGLTSPSVGETGSTDPELQEAGFQVYAPNSLLAQQAAIKPEPKRSQAGPFLSTEVDPKVANPYGENSLLNRQDNRQYALGDVTPRMSLINGISAEDQRRSLAVPYAESGLIQQVGAGGRNRYSTMGPLLGTDVGNDNHKPKLQEGLLGDLERRKNDINLIKKGGVVTAHDAAAEILIPQLSVVVQRMMNQLYHPAILPTHSVLDSLRGDVSILFNLISQYQMQKGPSYRNDRMSMTTGQIQSLAGQNRVSINPFAMPNISWKQTSTAASLSSSEYQKKSGTISSSISQSSGSYTSSAGKTTSGTENSSDRRGESSGTEDEDSPLAKSSKGSTESSSEGSESEESSDSSAGEDVPLGLVADGSKIKQYSSSSHASYGNPVSTQQRAAFYPNSTYSQPSSSGSLNRPLVFSSTPNPMAAGMNQRQSYQAYQQQQAQAYQHFGVPYQNARVQSGTQGMGQQLGNQIPQQAVNPKRQNSDLQPLINKIPSRPSSGMTTPKNNSSVGSISDLSPATSLYPSSSVGSVSENSKVLSPKPKPSTDKSRGSTSRRKAPPPSDNSSEGSVSDESD